MNVVVDLTDTVDAIKETLRRKLSGWCAYFKYAKDEKWAKDTDEWIRRRIRQLLWKTWKRIRTRFAALKKLECTEEKTYMWACTRKSYWRTANSQVLNTTLTNDFLKSRGWCWLGLVRVDGYRG